VEPVAPTLVLAAVGAPVVAGLATLLLPWGRTSLRVLLATCGPLASLLFLGAHLRRYGVASNEEGTTAIGWVPSLHLDLGFLVDGLATFFALLVASVGVLIVLYARAYFGDDGTSLARFFPALGFFTSSMLGVVLADHLLLTVLFWEATSIGSFFLIGWDRDDETAVKRATQAFVTTGLGGLSLLGGVLLLGDATGSWRWSELVAGAADIGSGGTIVAAFVLIFIGAASKSAQWPFHYWLPGAMLAPTPVSAFLHSATMVKAGVFLLGRLLPVFGLLSIWLPVVVVFGAVTMLLGAVLALQQHDLKRIFAYTTVSQLGLFVCMYGLGGATDGHGGAAIDWDLSQIASHALYKAPLFLIAGALAHRVGARRLPELFGLWRRRVPGARLLVVVLLAAAYALAGGPGTVSFVAKEMFFGAVHHAAGSRPLLVIVGAMAVLTAMCNVAIAVRLAATVFGWRTGVGDEGTVPAGGEGQGRARDRWGALLWLPAAGLVAFQYVGGLVPPLWNSAFRRIEVHVNDVAFADGLPWPWEPFLHPGVPLAMSVAAIVLGIALGCSSRWRGEVTDVHDRIYPGSYRLVLGQGHRAFHTVQTGRLRNYLVLMFAMLLLSISWAAWIDPSMLRLPDGVVPFESLPGLLLGAVVCAAAIALPLVTERVVRVMVLGASGFAVVGLYLVYQAPDLALTQLMFEIISVILFLLVLRLLPRPDRRPRISPAPRLVMAALVGITIGWMTLLAGHAAEQRNEDAATLGAFFEEHSLEGSELTNGRGGEGRNIVNVILVDFRGFDTLGEITVLATAALGVWSMLPGRRRHEDDEDGGSETSEQATSAVEAGP
jgi:multicomponent K+:H+ antiporter subunit A